MVVFNAILIIIIAILWMIVGIIIIGSNKEVDS
jgi:hypothetical protein